MTTTDSSSAVNSTSALQAYLNQQAQQIAAKQAASSSSSSSSSLAQSTSASTIGSNFNTFINILTTQLQHQDPTNATDPNQFTQELVQFAGVEQQLNTNNDLQTLINLQKNSSGATAALNYMGQFVQGPVTDGQFPVQGGSSELAYNLKTPASSVKIAIENSSGQTLTTLTGSGNSGANYISWDGKDSSGTQQPDGTYKFVITATNADGSSQTPTSTEIIGAVTGITSNSDGTSTLSLGGVPLSTSSVDNVYYPGKLPASTAPAPSTGS